MLTVALVGGDGAGKTTVARSLEKRCSPPVKTLYMGPSILSSDRPLPSSLLARSIKMRLLRKSAREPDTGPESSISSHDFHYTPSKRGAFWLAVRLINRLAETSYRHLLSLIYRWQGYVVVYDRHILFDVSPAEGSPRNRLEALFNRLEYFFISRFFPKPGVVIFLDAPAHVLYGRKNESSIDSLARRRVAIIEQGRKMTDFVRIDATQPLDRVLAEVIEHITRARDRASRRRS